MTIPLLSKLGSLAGNLIPFLIVLAVIVFVHEMGHFLIARYNGVYVKSFSIGFGPELFGWTDKRGTRWKVSMCPLGGYVMMLGDADASSTKADLEGIPEDQLQNTLPSKTPLQRMMVALGGPLFNVLFTILLMVILGIGKGVPDLAPRIQEVMKESPAAACHLQEGDLITALDDTPINTFQDMSDALARLKGKDVTLHFRRGNEEQSASLALYKVEADGTKTPLDRLGVRIGGSTTFRKVSPVEAVTYSLKYCVAATAASCRMIAKMITREDGGQVGSLLSIGDGAKQSMGQGLFPFLSFMAMLSFSLGFFNLLPIPVLDGGSILLNFIEIVIRRPLPVLVTNIVYIIGMGLVGLLMIVALWNDFMRYGLFDRCGTFIRGLFGR